MLAKFRPEVRALRDLTMEDLEHYRNQISSVDFQRSRHVITENDRVEDAKRALESADL